MTLPSALVVLDFAGTLSLDTVAFARPERLTAALRHSGLAVLGVDSPAVFWARIIEPTWPEGSTTDTGYATVVADATARLRRARRQQLRPRAVRMAAEAFAADYLSSSTIAPGWRPWLHALRERTDAVTLIATDHYAELTGHLVALLDSAAVRATPLPTDGRRLSGTEVAVANSADLGCHKTDPVFWHQVRAALPAPPTAVLVVDDFGAHEVSDSAYGASPVVRRRRDRIIAVLTEVFGIPPQAHRFQIGRREDAPAAVDRAGRWLETVLGREGPGVGST